MRAFGLSPVQVLPLGTSTKTVAEFHAWIASVRHRFTEQTYDLFRHNCNNFSDAAAKFLLGGQGIRGSFKFLFPSFMIGRFFGGFTPGGFGLDGWKLADVGLRTKKWARPLAVLGVEKVLGQLAFGVVVMGASIWGVTFIGISVFTSTFFCAWSCCSL